VPWRRASQAIYDQCDQTFTLIETDPGGEVERSPNNKLMGSTVLADDLAAHRRAKKVSYETTRAFVHQAVTML